MQLKRALMGVVVATTMMVAVPTHAPLSAQQNPNAPGQQKKYKATRPIAVDATTGAVRMPTTEEVADTVTTLINMTKRDSEGLPRTTLAGGGTVVNLEGGFNGVIVARPNGDGTFETLCVFTFEEAAEFLGLVEDNQ